MGYFSTSQRFSCAAGLVVRPNTSCLKFCSIKHRGEDARELASNSADSYKHVRRDLGIQIGR